MIIHSLLVWRDYHFYILNVFKNKLIKAYYDLSIAKNGIDFFRFFFHFQINSFSQQNTIVAPESTQTSRRVRRLNFLKINSSNKKFRKILSIGVDELEKINFNKKLHFGFWFYPPLFLLDFHINRGDSRFGMRNATINLFFNVTFSIFHKQTNFWWVLIPLFSSHEAFRFGLAQKSRIGSRVEKNPVFLFTLIRR